VKSSKKITLQDLVIALFLVNLCLAIVVGGGFLYSRAADWLGKAGSNQSAEDNTSETVRPRPIKSEKKDSPEAALPATPTPKHYLFLPYTLKAVPQPYPAPSDQGEMTWVDNTLAGMSLDQKVGQLLLVGVNGDQVNQENCGVMQGISPGGVFYQEGGNVFGPNQLRQFSEGLQECNQTGSSVPLLFAIDHEGVYIHRFKEKVTTFPTALAFAATGEPELAYQAARAAGEELAFSGINMVLGPVADVLLDHDNGIFANRTYGGDPLQAQEFVSAVVRGYQDAEIIPVIKHFPGHGGVATDPHEQLPVDPVDPSRLREIYLPTFKAGLQAGARVVMIGHAAFPNITGDNIPATLSPKMVAYLRDELDFDGVILSDALNMKAVSRSGAQVSDSAVSAIQAGLDMVLVNRPGQVTSAYQSLIDAVQQGAISEERIDESVRRILALKAVYHRQYTPFSFIAQEPDWAGHQALEREVGYKSVTVVRDLDGLVPLPQGKPRVMIVGASEDWTFYPQLIDALKKKGFQPELFAFAEAQSQRSVEELDYPQTLPPIAQNYDLVIVFTYQSRIKSLDSNDAYQGNLVESLVKSGKPVLAIAVRAPTDILEYPDVPSYIALYGTPDGTLEGLLAVLLGDKPPVGKNPLPDFP
jgi:beta-N-acetylhexosaminidase